MNFVNNLFLSLILIINATTEDLFASNKENDLPQHRYSSPHRNIQAALDENKFSSPQVKKINEHLHALQVTPGGSSQKIALSVITTMKDKISFGEQAPSPMDMASLFSTLSPVENNRKILAALGSPDRKIKQKVSMINSAAENLSSPQKRQCSVVDTLHAVVPKISKKPDGSIREVVGGHNLASYQPGLLRSRAFISQDGNTYGVIVGNRFGKTVRRNFTEDEALGAVKDDSLLVATFKKHFEMYQRSHDGTLFGTYRAHRFPLLIDSVFPVLTVENTSATQGSVNLGCFGEISADHTAIVISSPSITLSAVDFQNMLDQGKPLCNVENSTIVVTDISAPVEAYLKDNHYLDTSCTEKFFPIYAWSRK